MKESPRNSIPWHSNFTWSLSSTAWRGADSPPRVRVAAETVGGGSRPVSRVLSRTAIHLGRTSPCASSDLPGGPRGPRGAALRPHAPLFGLAPEWGLPCRRCCHRRGALLPHHFTLTAPPRGGGWRCIFCGTFRGLAPPRRYLAPCPLEPGLSSPAGSHPRRRLSGRLPETVYSPGERWPSVPVTPRACLQPVAIGCWPLVAQRSRRSSPPRPNPNW